MLLSGPTFPDLVNVLYLIAAVEVLVYWQIGIWKNYNVQEADVHSFIIKDMCVIFSRRLHHSNSALEI